MNKKRTQLLEVAMRCLIDVGYEQLSMNMVAKQAGASKETLYRHFGDKRRLLVGLIEYKSQDAEMFKPYAKTYSGDINATLMAIGKDVLNLVLGEQAIAINRLVIAASDKQTLATLLDEKGRQPVIEHIHTQLQQTTNDENIIKSLDLFFALLIRDAQLNAITGLKKLTKKQIEQRASIATQQFLTLINHKGEQ